jgi:hypothetical protein
MLQCAFKKLRITFHITDHGCQYAKIHHFPPYIPAEFMQPFFYGGLKSIISGCIFRATAYIINEKNKSRLQSYRSKLMGNCIRSAKLVLR